MATITGKIAADTGAAAPGILAQAYDKRVNGDVFLGQGIADKEGNYTVTYSAELLKGKDKPDLEVRAVETRDPKNILGKSAIRYNAGSTEIINVIIRSGNVPRNSEYERLVSELQPNLGDTALGNLQENGNNNHITLLSNKTGWDARAVAMAAQANKLGTATRIPAVHYYALFRAGIAADNETLSRVPAATVQSILSEAEKNKLIPAGTNIQDTVKMHTANSVDYLLGNSEAVGVSTLGTMLGIRLNDDQKKIFAESYKEASGNTDKLWKSLQEKGIAQDTISKLQLDGKLGYLTLQNVNLVKKVYETFQVSDPADLIRNGLYKASEWKRVIGNDVPEGFSIDDYAKTMANQLSLSYPTAVAAEMVRNNEIVLNNNQATEVVYNFLNSDKQKNSLGIMPVKKWENFNQLSIEAKAAVKQVERMYQLSPSNESMTALSKSNISSAYQIVQYSRNEFIEKYGKTFPTTEEAALTYTKAQEVYSSVTNLATTYITYRASPNVYSLSGITEKKQNEIIAYPTLEELFGNMDYCSCDHCKSVLSAAAYMVDLLQFIELKDIPHTKQNPLTVLLERRPDIQHLQLSCENTNTALPYIDLVNEILEYYIANGSLTTFKGYNILEDTNPNDLLADPQFVIATAYDNTKSKIYPYNLPFDQPREALRLFFSAWDTSLEEGLRVFSTQLAARKERLGLNLAEYDILTNINLHALPEYFGLPAAATIDAVNAAVANAKIFSRRVDITYDELVRILKTQFINPGIVLVPLLTQLQITLSKIQEYYNGVINDVQLTALLPAGLDTTAYGGNPGQWLKDNEQLIMGMILLTDINAENTDCNLATMELRYARPDMTINKLDAIAYHKLHRFIRIWKKSGWSIETMDQVITILSPAASAAINLANLDATFVIILARLANFSRLAEMLSITEKKIPTLLLLWDNALDVTVRETQCASLLKMRIEDLRDLAKVTGLDPLSNDLETDTPAINQFVKITKDLKLIPLKIPDLSWLLMHKDTANKLTPSETTLLKHVKLIRDAVNTVVKENSVAPDNADLSFAKSKMSLVYDSIVTDILFSLLTNSKTYTSSLNLPEEALPAPLTANARLGYDPFKKLLSYSGILTTAEQTALNNAADALTLADVTEITLQPALDAFIADFKLAIQNIKTASDDDLATLAADYPELKTVYDIVVAQPTPAQQTTALIGNILPALLVKLKEIALRQTLVTISKADANIIATLTSDETILHGLADATKNILNDFFLLQSPIVFNNNQTYDGFLDAPATDDFILYIKAPANTTLTLIIDGVTAINNITLGAGGETQSALPVSLKAGLLTPLQLVVAGLPVAGNVSIWWRTKGMAKTEIPGNNFYSKAGVDQAKASLLRLLKAVQLQQLLQLTSPELAYFASVNTEIKDVLNNLPVSNTIADPDLHALWQKISLLVFFNLLRKETEQDENTWLQVLKKPDVQTPQGKSILLDMNSWLQTDVDMVLAKLGKTWNDLSALSVLRNLVQGMQLVTTINYPAASVIACCVDNPDKPLIDSIKVIIRSKTEGAAWLDTMQSVSDILRNKQRDALISYVLHHQAPSAEINTADKLYEYFLIDVQMDACMMTSRIRQALSTIQLFINRCLMNLEPDVAPASINANQWKWMQRYRVWEANRKIFLYPENWLEPELRDGKSAFYKELEGELLQSDLDNDLAETAFLNYLKKLDNVAHLEIAGMYLQENQQGNQNDDILHVFGRTNGNTRQYYYRRFEYGYWTAWEKVGLTIEGDHIFPVIWKDHLFVFWLNVVEKAKKQAGDETPKEVSEGDWGPQAKKDVEINMCWGEFYKGKWSSPKSSELKEPVVITDLTNFDSRNVLLYTRKEQKDPKTSEHLIFYLFYIGDNDSKYTCHSITFTSKNSPPIIEEVGSTDNFIDQVVIFNYTLFRQVYEGANPSRLNATTLKVPSRDLKVLITQPELAAQSTVTEKILSKTNKLFPGFRILPLRHLVENQWQAPFVYHDEQSVFVVHPDEEETKPLWAYTGYYDIGVSTPPLYEVAIKPLVEKPVITKPPRRGIPNPSDPVINPAQWDSVIKGANENYKVILPGGGNFSFDKATFGVGGKNFSINDIAGGAINNQ